jgi:molybdopterin synthase sulfur carrier subunit
MEIKLYATLRPIVGGPSVKLNGTSELTVEEMLNQLYTVYPDLRQELHKGREELHPSIHILVNGRDMRYIDGTDTVLKPDDDIRIFPPVGGGR